MESQANRNKVLERLDYDPKTQTIDTGIKKKNGEPIRIRIEIIHGKENGKFMPDDEDENVDEFIQYSYIKINKKILNMNNNAPMGVIYHEIGHFADMLVKKYSEDIDVSTVNLVKKINKYADKNVEKIADSGIKLNEHDGNKVEVVADTYSTNKTSKHTHDYRIKFLEDMKHIHEGHPERCSMKYPTMTPADKKYMQEFTVEEMYLSNIITESEYLQLQERIQILTERSE